MKSRVHSYLAEDGQREYEFLGFETIDVAPADRQRALALVNAALQPAPRPLILQELARLRVTTKSRLEAEDDLRLMAAAYTEHLGNFPADVVVDALRYWARTERWWPALAELEELLERRVERRRALKAALEPVCVHARSQNWNSE